SYPQPDWLIDRQRLGERLPPRVRARELWRVPEPYLEEAQDDATRLAVQDMERAGVDVITEKPLTTDADGCRRIVDAARASQRELVVTFNYRYSPRNAAVQQLIADGAVGEVTSVHFEWVLDTVHGADYFRRWHRDKAKSGGLLVHKATHHFDLVNWWIDDVPETVFALGALRFYGERNARARGLGERPARSHGAPSLGRDPFALDLAADDRLRQLYLEAEAEDGYLRDLDVFSPGITIEDNMAVLVGYAGGAMLSYSLNAHSPWEGYRVGVNGTAGRIELDVVERGRGQGTSLVLQRHWEPARRLEIPKDAGDHGGGDALLLDDLFRPGTHALGVRGVPED
ncbi:MAG: Gfo/Idh/MocA family oxidoreductase, partial [Pseudonocardiaceae bacterium]